MAQLSLATLSGLPASATRPAYDVGRIGVGIIHLGLGAFHRAHQAVYTDDILAADPRWGICGVSLKTPRATQELAAQDGLYSVLTRSSVGVTARVIGAVRETIFAGTHRDALVARLADPRIAVVSLTVTEKGYCHDPATGALNVAHPDIVHDLALPALPQSVVGLLAAGFAARRVAGAGALTVVCCDNLPHNGRMVGALLRAYVAASRPELGSWIDDHVAFPATMVDRIVPATTDADRTDALRLLGVTDAAPVAAEPFGQWIIENQFHGARPPWDAAGAQWVSDVAPFEAMKLRLLNGSHSALAYLGFLLGHDTVWQASADPLLARLVERQMSEEVVPTLVPPPGIDLAAYTAELMARFRNTALPHRTRQIAMDGSQKLPQRLLGTVRDRIKAGAPYPHLTLAIAGWIRYAAGSDESGKSYEVQDPLAADFASIVRDAGGDAGALADGFLDLHSVFGHDLVAHYAFREAVRAQVIALFTNGTKATLAQHLGKR